MLLIDILPPYLIYQILILLAALVVRYLHTFFVFPSSFNLLVMFRIFGCALVPAEPCKLYTTFC